MNLPAQEPGAARISGYLWTIAAAAAWLGFAALTLAIPQATFDNGLRTDLAGVAFALSIVIGILLLLAILLAAERAYWSRPARIAMFATGLVFVFTAYFLDLKAPTLRPLLALALLSIAIPVGYWIGERMEKITNLIPLAIAMSMADIFSVFQGPTRQIAAHETAYREQVSTAIAQHGPAAAVHIRAPLADYVMVHFPIAGQATSTPVLGIGDFVILAFLLRAAWVHNMSPRLMLLSSLMSILAAVSASTWLERGLPALPFIAVGTIGALWLSQPRMRRLDRQEVVLSVAVAALFGALITGKYLSGLF